VTAIAGRGGEKIKTKRERPLRISPFLKGPEELFLLLGRLLGGGLLGCFLLSCHGESPPLQIALSARNRANENLSLTKD
jgi:hypothetical protein